uniref:Protocadherin alpha-11 n=1 Tax=Lygus hesperus TaxID=30085 RepID=A0A0A9XZS5_LYGHE
MSPSVLFACFYRHYMEQYHDASGPDNELRKYRMSNEHRAMDEPTESGTKVTSLSLPSSKAPKSVAVLLSHAIRELLCAADNDRHTSNGKEDVNETIKFDTVDYRYSPRK